MDSASSTSPNSLNQIEVAASTPLGRPKAKHNLTPEGSFETAVGTRATATLSSQSENSRTSAPSAQVNAVAESTFSRSLSSPGAGVTMISLLPRSASEPLRYQAIPSSSSQEAKEKPKLNYFFTTIWLAILSYKPIGTKLTFVGNSIDYQVPNLDYPYVQGIKRMVNGDLRADLQILEKPINDALECLDLSDLRVKKILLMAVQGLEILKQTYSKDTWVVNTLKLYTNTINLSLLQDPTTRQKNSNESNENVNPKLLDSIINLFELAESQPRGSKDQEKYLRSIYEITT